MLVFDKVSPRNFFCLLSLSFIFCSFSLKAYNGGNQNSFYGIKKNLLRNGVSTTPFIMKNFWDEKDSRYSSIVDLDAVKSPTKVKRYKGSYNAFSTLENRFYKHEFVYYKPKLKEGEKAPLIIIVPPVVGITPLDYITASYFANNGLSAVVLKLNVPKSNVDYKLEEVGPQWENYIDKVRAFVDVSHNLPGADVTRIGIKGVSLGGITAAISMGRDIRIKASVIYMGGIDLPVIMAHSEQPVVKKLRQRKMKNLDLVSKNEYEEVLRKNVKIKLPFLTKGRQVKDYYLFVVLDDDYVPGEVQVSLREKLGFPETIFLEKGHVMNGIFYSIHLKKMRDYFEKRFSLGPFPQS